MLNLNVPKTTLKTQSEDYSWWGKTTEHLLSISFALSRIRYSVLIEVDTIT